MVTGDSNPQVGLDDFLRIAGLSISDAQSAIAPSEQSTDIIIGNAEVEAKVTIESTAAGRLAVRTLSRDDLRNSKVDAGLLSTVKINFTAAASEPGKTRLGAQPPKRDPKAVIEEVSARPDVATLVGIIGPLEYQATFIPEQRRWLVTAHDAKGRLARETVVPD